MLSFEVQNAFNVHEVQFTHFWFLLFMVLVSYLRNCCLIQAHGDLPLCFLLRVLQFWLYIQVFDHFAIFVYDVRNGFNFIHSHVDV